MNKLKIIVSKITGKPRDIALVYETDQEVRILDAEPPTEDEKLVEVGSFNDYVKPVFNEALQDFKETATPEEIAAARPTPPVPEPSAENYLLDFEYRLSKLELGV